MRNIVGAIAWCWLAYVLWDLPTFEFVSALFATWVIAVCTAMNAQHKGD